MKQVSKFLRITATLPTLAVYTHRKTHANVFFFTVVIVVVVDYSLYPGMQFVE